MKDKKYILSLMFNSTFKKLAVTHNIINDDLGFIGLLTEHLLNRKECVPLHTLTPTQYDTELVQTLF